MWAKLEIACIYLGARSNLNYEFVQELYDGDASSTFFDEGSEIKSVAHATLGFVGHWDKDMSFYIGAGYGIRDYTATQYNNSNKEHIRYSIEENSSQGLVLECGVQGFVEERVGLTLGITTLKFKYTDLSLGLIFKL